MFMERGFSGTPKQAVRNIILKLDGRFGAAEKLALYMPSMLK
jgi:hypothetical protein